MCRLDNFLVAPVLARLSLTLSERILPLKAVTSANAGSEYMVTGESPNGFEPRTLHFFSHGA